MVLQLSVHRKLDTVRLPEGAGCGTSGCEPCLRVHPTAGHVACSKCIQQLKDCPLLRSTLLGLARDCRGV